MGNPHELSNYIDVVNKGRVGVSTWVRAQPPLEIRGRPLRSPAVPSCQDQGVSGGRRKARTEDVHDLATAMPHVTVVNGPGGNPVYQVGQKSFVFFRNPRPDAVDPDTGDRYPDVIVFWVPSEFDKQALVQDQTSPFFTTQHFDGHNSGAVAGQSDQGAHPAGVGRGHRGCLAVTGVVGPGQGVAGGPSRAEHGVGDVHGRRMTDAQSTRGEPALSDRRSGMG